MKKILYATDLSKSTQAVMPYLGALADSSESSVLFMNVYNRRNGHNPEIALAELSKKFADVSMSATDFVLRNGDVPDEIIKLAKAIKADLIVMAANKNKSLKELVTGSFTGHVIHRSNLPMILIPDNARFRKIQNIVYAADPASWDARGFAKLARMAEKMEAAIMVLNLITGETKESIHEAGKLVEKIRSTSKYARVDFHFYRTDDVSRGIREFIDRYDIDLIAVSHHKGKIEESVAQALAASTQIPLLIFPL